MITGIYQLNFQDQAYYIGQSQNIEIRMKQHSDKFLKGTAAQKMQEAYNVYGMPNAEVLIRCHKDHLDALESYFISMRKALPGCLNTSSPKLDPDINYAWMLENPQMLQFSAFEVMSKYVETHHEHVALQADHDDLWHNFNREYMLHKATAELRDGKDENEQLVKAYHSRLQAAQTRLNQLNRRGFLQRLFNYD